MHRNLAALVALVLAACSTNPPGQQTSPAFPSGDQARSPKAQLIGEWTADRIPPGSKIAIAVGKFEPKLIVLESRSGRSSGKGGIGQLGKLCGPIFVCIAAVLIVDIAVQTTAHYSPEATERRVANADAAANRKDKMQDVSASVFFARILEAEVESYRDQLAGREILRVEGPVSSDDPPRYAAADYVVEIAVIEVVSRARATRTSIDVVTRGRLVRAADNAIVDTFIQRRSTALRTVDQWAALDKAALTSEVSSLVAGRVSAFLDEWILLHRGAEPPGLAEPPSSRSEGARRVPGYVLRPLEPQLVRQQSQFGECRGGSNCLRPANVADLTPTLSWEKLPRDMPDALFVGAAPSAKQLSYDVQIFDGAFLMSSHTGIRDAELKLKEPLPSCRTFYWTVRARYELDGRQRATEWSGAYRHPFNEGGVDRADIDLRELRRERNAATSNDLAETQRRYFFPFRTPCQQRKP